VQTSVLSLIDLAGSEKATSDKERTREGKYINTRWIVTLACHSWSLIATLFSLLTLGSVIATLAENASKGKKYANLPSFTLIDY
jgi:centromeric protein E